MSSILTNNSAMSALSTLRNINQGLSNTQDRISTGLKVSSGKDNAAYFAISESMKGDSSMTKSVNESLTLTKNSVATARLGAEQFSSLASEFRNKVAFAQENKGGLDEIEADLTRLVADMDAIISQSTFNGDDLVNASGGDGLGGAATGDSSFAADGTYTGETTASGAAASRNVVSGVSRDAAGALTTTTISVAPVDLNAEREMFRAIADGFAGKAGSATGEAYLTAVLSRADTAQSNAVSAATTLGQAEKSIETQQEFLTKLADNLDSGVGAMVDANMEEEAARLQALQVQQQLASQSLSIANQAPQNILSLFR
ncbi:flagellin [Limimaricola pyoseonensis]|uniref:Flagellin n=1 Tax=Limimaricola pyoseonensis TaxID=521013 RepID=A0A1G7KB96_9RHOB|nr:flagellin [Limimaricola pyoseonensis]SDF34588.1 flagellin [Limimaricola pyoseonensis]